MLGALTYIVSSSTRAGVDEAVLSAELQQLGLPRENTDGVTRPFKTHAARLRAAAARDSLRLPRLLSLAVRSDALLATAAVGALPVPPPAALHFSLGLSHLLGGRRPRALAADATPLLLAAAPTAATSRAAPPAPPTLLAFVLAASATAAMAAAGAVPLIGVFDATAPPLPQPPVAAHFTASAEQAAALLAELRVAREVLRRVTA